MREHQDQVADHDVATPATGGHHDGHTAHDDHATRDGGDAARERRAQLRADVELLRAAAGALRHRATQGGYLGHLRPDHAYSLASILDTLSLRPPTDVELLDALRSCCRTLLAPDHPQQSERSV